MTARRRQKKKKKNMAARRTSRSSRRRTKAPRSSTVRGISQARNSQPSVAVIIDGVLMSNPAQFNAGALRRQQIEVLKGAQGAVYGRNAIGGAIVITTRRARRRVRGPGFKLGYDSGPGVRVQVGGDGPLGAPTR